MKRLFFALWPDQATRERCICIINRLPLDELFPVATTNLHVTLQFLGQVSDIQEAALIAAASKLTVSNYTLVFNQLSFWQKPSILCLTCEQAATEVSELARQLGLIALANNIGIDPRPYQAHITLARKAHKQVAMPITPVIWSGQSFCLVESCNQSDDVHYRVIKTFNSPPLK